MPVIGSPQIHPDGKRIFFASNTRAPNEVRALEKLLVCAESE
jgi:hypothetical protein